MPTYEYRCPEGHTFDRFQKITDKPRAKCPVCGRAASRLISGGAGLVFKGSGFYITDYGKDGKGPRKESEKPAGEAPSTGDKPAAEKSGGESGSAPAPAEKPAPKSAKPRSHSKKARE
jgi:putative FmdB family regulatory protein